MKVSLNWIRDFLEINNTPAEIEEILTSLGLEVEGWEEVKPSPVDLDKVLTGLVLSCERIPDTDHLSATQVDVGDGIPRSIVCGAPNVAAGQRVLVAIPGANVFSKDGTLFTIGERKVKGIPSQGMICAEDELGIGHDHSGIMVLPNDTPLGVTAASYLSLASDIVFEVGLTPNRADATHHKGVAQDLLAHLRYHNGHSEPLKSLPTKDLSGQLQVPTPITVEVANADACLRYSGVSFTGVQVGESPDWLKNRLLAVGQRPINNIVDITNYVRIEMGQPLHAFDQSQISGATVRVRTLPEGTEFLSLDTVTRKLFAEDLMICDGNDLPMCIGGVFGGLNSGVKDSTTDVFLESACFHPKYIRRSMLRHNLRTDAAWTFEKGVDPNGCMLALQRAAYLICEIAGATVVGGVIDLYPKPVEPVRIPFGYASVNRLVGDSWSSETQHRLLASLDIKTEEKSTTGAVALIPTNKPDVTRPADLIEEMLRVYGLDNVPMPQSIRSSMEITPKPDPDAIRSLIADTLTAQGFNECMSLSLSNSDYFQGEKAILPQAEGSLVRVHNTANQGLDCLRPTMLINGLEAIRNNQNRQTADLRLYEFGKVYHKLSTNDTHTGPNYSDLVAVSFSEIARLAIFLTGAYQSESWQVPAKKSVDFYTLKANVNTLLNRLGVQGYQETVQQNEGPFQFALRYHRGQQELVTFGKVQSALTKKFDVKNEVFFADFNIDNLIQSMTNLKVQYKELSRFPVVRRDLALVLEKSVAFSEVKQLSNKTIKKTLKEINLFDVFEDENKLGAGKKSYAVSFLFEDPEKTLQDKEIDAMMNQLQVAFETKLGANVRK